MLQLRNKKSMTGALWLVEQQYTLGNDSSSDIKVVGDAVHPRHAELIVDGDNVELVNRAGETGLEVNGKAVTERISLKPGDTVRLGFEEFELLDPKSIRAKGLNLSTESQGWALKALNTALADKHFPLQGSQTIGRSKECDVSLGVVHLSRMHAKVAVTDKGLQIQDLNSSNGTYINGKKISQALAIAGDEISFDTLRFRVIGPIIDKDKTTLVPLSDGDLTTIRPAVNLSQADALKPTQKPKPRQRPPQQAKITPKVDTLSKADREPKSHGIVWAGIAVLVGAGVAWFFLK